MNDGSTERRKAATAARDVLSGRITWEVFSDLCAECEDPLIEELFDLLEHEPQRGGFLGASEHEWQQYRRGIEEVILKLERSAPA